MKTLFVLTIAICSWFSVNGYLHGDTHARISELSQQIIEDPSNAILYFQRANLYLDHGDLDSALTDYDIAIDLNPTLYNVHLQKSNLLYKQSNFREALDQVNGYIKLAENNIELGYLQRARINVSIDEFEMAINDYRKALQYDSPQLPQVYLELADVLKNSGIHDYMQAVDCLNDGIQRLGAIQAFQLKIIEIYVEQNQYENALEILDSIIMKVARKERWLDMKGDVYMEMDETELAKNAYQNALTEINNLSSTRKNTAFVYQLVSEITNKLNKIQTN